MRQQWPGSYDPELKGHCWSYGSETLSKCKWCGKIVDRKRGQQRPVKPCPEHPEK